MLDAAQGRWLPQDDARCRLAEVCSSPPPTPQISGQDPSQGGLGEGFEKWGSSGDVDLQAVGVDRHRFERTEQRSVDFGRPSNAELLWRFGSQACTQCERRCARSAGC